MIIDCRLLFCLLALISFVCPTSIFAQVSRQAVENDESGLIVFGSCLRQHKAQPVWDTVLSFQPEQVVLLGDNVYTDIAWYKLLPVRFRYQLAYRRLASEPSFAQLLKQTEVLAAWDDHDYGRNNAGADYPHKALAKSYFLNFFGVPPSAPVRLRDGNYRVFQQRIAGLDVQTILLDTRTFRDPINSPLYGKNCQLQSIDDVFQLQGAVNSSPILLGEQQWQWLEEQLRKPADIRLLVSSIQVLSVDHCFEKWANFPSELYRLMNLLRDTRVNNAIILSGDRHHGDISIAPAEWSNYPLYEVTASGLNSARPQGIGSNRFRIIENAVGLDHFGAIHILRRNNAVFLRLQLIDVEGNLLRELELPLVDLQVPIEKQS